MISMGFFEAIANFFKSLFGGKKTVEITQDTYPVVNPDYELEGSITNVLILAKTAAKLTDEEYDDLVNQVVECRKRDLHHFVINTHGRGETSPYDERTGDRYFEVEWLKRAKVHHIASGFNGESKERMLVSVPDTSIWYDNLKEKFV